MEYSAPSPSLPPQIVVPPVRRATPRRSRNSFRSVAGLESKCARPTRGEAAGYRSWQPRTPARGESAAEQTERKRLRRVEALEELREAFNLESVPAPDRVLRHVRDVVALDPQREGSQGSNASRSSSSASTPRAACARSATASDSSARTGVLRQPAPVDAASRRGRSTRAPRRATRDARERNSANATISPTRGGTTICGGRLCEFRPVVLDRRIPRAAPHVLDPWARWKPYRSISRPSPRGEAGSPIAVCSRSRCRVERCRPERLSAACRSARSRTKKRRLRCHAASSKRSLPAPLVFRFEFTRDRPRLSERNWITLSMIAR